MRFLSAKVDKIVGKGAPEDFIEKLEGVANSHHDQLVVDVIRAYFFGARFIVEVTFFPVLLSCFAACQDTLA